eukprot:Lankesteria_metandrocarpae@DN4732_c0_g1_i1.p1
MSLPADTSNEMETLYVFLVCVTLGCHMVVVVTTTLCSIWGPGLALRGPNGSDSMHTAIENLRREQKFVFSFFLFGMTGFFLGNIVQVWCFFEPWVAKPATVVLTLSLAIFIYFTAYLIRHLKLPEEAEIRGRINALRPYETIGDLDTQLVNAISMREYPQDVFRDALAINEAYNDDSVYRNVPSRSGTLFDAH